MAQLDIKNIQFRTTIYESGFITHGVSFEPWNICKVFSQWLLEYRTSQSINNLIERIIYYNNKGQKSLESLTSNETHLYIRNNENVTFDAELITGLKPITISLKDTLSLFRKYRDWLEQYESCNIQGLIPESKLDSWSCVPNEYVKPEYWEKIKKISSGESGETEENV